MKHLCRNARIMPQPRTCVEDKSDIHSTQKTSECPKQCQRKNQISTNHSNWFWQIFSTSCRKGATCYITRKSADKSHASAKLQSIVNCCDCNVKTTCLGSASERHDISGQHWCSKAQRFGTTAVGPLACSKKYALEVWESLCPIHALCLWEAASCKPYMG